MGITIMLCAQDDEYRNMASVQLQVIREYSPNASAVLEKLYRYGAKAVFQAAFTVALYKSILEFTDGKPEQFDCYCFVEDYPQILPLLDQAINYLLEDWLNWC